jgi:hypothetical protein
MGLSATYKPEIQVQTSQSGVNHEAGSYTTNFWFVPAKWFKPLNSGTNRYCIYRLHDRLTTACVLAHSFEQVVLLVDSGDGPISRRTGEIRDSALAPHEPRRDVRDEIRRVTRPRHPGNEDPTSRRGLLKDCSPSFLKRGRRRVFERIGHRSDECLPRVLNRHALL